MKDFPINDLLSAETLADVKAGIESIGSHLE